MIDGCSLVDSGSSSLLNKLKWALPVAFKEHCAVKVKTYILKLGRVLGDDGPYLMIDLIREHMKNDGLCNEEARH